MFQVLTPNTLTLTGRRGDLGAKTYLIFAAAMFTFLIVAYFYYPEIKGRSAAELDEMFAARIPAREFKHTVFCFQLSRILQLTLLCFRPMYTRIQENIELKITGEGGMQEIEVIGEPKAVGA